MPISTPSFSLPKKGPGPPAQEPYQVRFRPAAGLSTMRWLVGAGVLCLLNFIWWLTTTARMGYAPLFWLLCISLGFKLLRILHEWTHYVQVREPIPPAYPTPPRRVDVLTTACPGEPLDMIIRTLEAMQAITYPHTSYLCDEGDDPVLRAACQRLGVVHVTRQVKVNAKAGNINNALRQATGEFCVVLDPDHVPTPDFLDKVMSYFEDERVGFVQVVQAYGNQEESLVARGAAEQTYHFYGPMMMGMNGYGTPMAIGANCTFRRAALDSIGGHAAGLTEDMHTAMRLHAAGWQSVYAPVVVSKGLVPASLAAFFSQQLKWSRGAFDLLFRVYPKLIGRFTWPQRLHYLVLPLYFFSGVVSLIDLSLPVVALGTSQFPWLVSLGGLALHALPLMGLMLLIRFYAQRWLRVPGESGLHLAGGLLRMGTWWVYTLGFVYAVLGVRVPYLPTPKEGRWGNEWLLVMPNLVLVGLLLAACHYGRVLTFGFYTNTMVFLAIINIVIVLAASAMGQHQALRNFVQDMASWPYRGLVLRLDRLQDALGRHLSAGLRRHSRGLALTVLLATGLTYYFHGTWLARVPPEWLLNGDQTVRIGQAVSPAEAPGAFTNNAVGLWTAAPTTPTYAVVALDIPAPGPAASLPPLVTTLIGQHQIPLLSWSMPLAATEQKDYWLNLAQQVKELPGSVLLRPRLTDASDSSYRRAWRQMVGVFRREQVWNAVWVWTPEAADTRLERFPGVAYTNWIAAPLLPRDGAPAYPALRQQLAQDLVLQQIPIMLLAPPAATNPQAAARRLTWDYPEIKVVVFTTPAPATQAAAGPGRGQASQVLR